MIIPSDSCLFQLMVDLLFMLTLAFCWRHICWYFDLHGIKARKTCSKAVNEWIVTYCQAWSKILKCYSNLDNGITAGTRIEWQWQNGSNKNWLRINFNWFAIIPDNSSLFQLIQFYLQLFLLILVYSSWWLIAYSVILLATFLLTLCSPQHKRQRRRVVRK